MSEVPVTVNRWARGTAYLLTLVALVAALLLVPSDTCGATMSGACVLADRPPFTLYGAVGDELHFRHGTVTVTEVAAGKTLRSRLDMEGPASTEGVVVLVAFTGSGQSQRTSLTAILVSDGRTYTSRGVVGERGFRAGIISTGWLVFDVPAAVAEQGFELELSLSGAVDRSAVVAVGPLTIAEGVTEPQQ